MEISVKLTLRLAEKKYEVDLSLPKSSPTKDAPFLFSVVQPDAIKNKEEKLVDDILLQVAIGDKEQVYVAVQPPKDLMVSAGIAQVVEDVRVIVAQGTFDRDKKTFA